MNHNYGQKDRVFWMQWTFATTVTMIVGGMLAFTVMWGAAAAVAGALGEIASFLVAGALFGTFMGGGASVGQALILRQIGIDAKQWILGGTVATALVSAVGWTIIFSLMNVDSLPESTAALVLGMSTGLPLAAGQWTVLRAHVINAGLWLLISPLAFLVAFFAGLPLGGEGRELLALAMVGLLSAAISGLGMTWLLRGQSTATA